MSHAPKPTIALLHGAFVESASWNQVIERLNHHTSIAIANPLRDLTSDAAYVRHVIGAIGTTVVLVAHSYGGMVITEAAGGNDAVLGLVYVNAFAPDSGESAFEL